MKTYVITLSRHFLANHKRAGEETHFKEKFLLGQGLTDYDTPSMVKMYFSLTMHTKRTKNLQSSMTIASYHLMLCIGQKYQSCPKIRKNENISTIQWR